MTFSLSPICDNCLDNGSIEEFSIAILHDDGLTRAITVRTDIAANNWNYNSGSSASSSFNNPQIFEVDGGPLSSLSSLEITDIPAGYSKIIINMNGDYIRGDGDTWAVDNLVLENQ